MIGENMPLEAGEGWESRSTCGRREPLRVKWVGRVTLTMPRLPKALKILSESSDGGGVGGSIISGLSGMTQNSG